MEKVDKQWVGTFITVMLGLFILFCFLEGFAKALGVFIFLAIIVGLIFGSFKFFGWMFKVNKEG